MGPIAVDVLRSDRAIAALPTSTAQADTADTFVQSLLANVVKGVPGPAPGQTNGSKAVEVAAVHNVETSAKDTKLDRDISIATMKHLESKSGSVKDTVKPVVSGRVVAVVKDHLAGRNQSVGTTKDARFSEVTKLKTSAPNKPAVADTKNLIVLETEKSEPSDAKDLDGSESKKLEMPGPKKLEGFEANEQEASQQVRVTKKLEGYEAKIEVTGKKLKLYKPDSSTADDIQTGDTASIQVPPTQSATDVPLTSLKASEVQSIVLANHPNGSKHSVNDQQMRSTMVTDAQREAKASSRDTVRPAKLSVSPGDDTSTVPGTVGQTKDGPANITPDVAAGGLAVAGKQEPEAGAIAAVHGGIGSTGQAGSPMVEHIANVTADLKTGEQQGTDVAIAFYPPSHNPAEQHGVMGESRPGLLTATPTSLEVGITNGTHGWLKIRAEMEGGLVTASLSSNSPAGQDILHRELPSLAAFLQDEKIGVNALVVKQAPTMDTSGATSEGFMQHQGQPSPRQDSSSAGHGLGITDEDEWRRPEQESMYEGWSGFGGTGGLLPVMTVGNGSWLNVRV